MFCYQNGCKGITKFSPANFLPFFFAYFFFANFCLSKLFSRKLLIDN